MRFIFVLLLAFILSGCQSDPEFDARAHKIVTALPNEVEGCSFLGNVDSRAHLNVQNARFELQRQTLSLGGTHLVETHIYPTLVLPRMLGVSLSGRAYLCKEGLGPKIPQALSQLELDLSPYQAQIDLLDDRLSRHFFNLHP